MSSESTDVEVIQSRLGWEPGDISEANPQNLKPHPKNKEIYGDTEHASDIGDQFIESVREKGVLEPLVVTKGKKIISGHRRWLAAKKAGKDSVPVRYSTFDSTLAEREAVIEFNRQREKTPGQIVNEFEEMVEIEEERTEEERVQKISDTLSQNSGTRETFPSSQSDEKRAREKAAEKINASVSGRTLEKGLKVKEKAESEDTPEPVRQVAEKQLKKLNEGKSSFHRASKAVEEAEAEHEVEEQEDPESEYKPRVQQLTATELLNDIQSPDLVIADPPYSTELDNTVEFARGWISPLVETIGDRGRAFIFIGAYANELEAYLNALSGLNVLGRVQILPWSYKNTLGQTPNEQYKQNWQAVLFIQSDPPTELDCPKTSEQWAVQDINAPDARNGTRYHRWQKPEELIRRFIRHTTSEDDLVVDPFVGTGTTVLAAADLGREAIGADKDPEMLEIAEERGCHWDE